MLFAVREWLTNRLGWVLIHRKASPKQEPGPKEFVDTDDLKDWLGRVWKSDRLWHWKRARPLRPDGPYAVLFGFDGSIWSDAKVETTHKVSARVRRRDFNFAFRFLERPSAFSKRQPISLEPVVGDHLAHHHRDLIVLDDGMLSRYRRLRSEFD